MNRPLLKKGILALIVIAIMVCAIVLLLPAKTPQERFFYKTLDQNVEMGKMTIFLNQLTNFKWDQGIFLGSYGIDPSSKFVWIDDKKVALEEPINLHSDGAWVFVFFKNGKVAGIIHDRHYNYDRTLKYGAFSQQAKIVVTGKQFTILDSK